MVIDMKEIGEMIKQYYNDGDIYEGDWRNNNREGKGYIIILLAIEMKENLEMIIEKEKEYIIILMMIEKLEII